jgi:hypothetical protein
MTLPALDKSSLLKQVLWYTFAFIGVWYCGKNFRSGPCTPGLDVFSWLFITGSSFLLLSKNVFVLVLAKDKERIYSIAIHAVAFFLLWNWDNL